MRRSFRLRPLAIVGLLCLAAALLCPAPALAAAQRVALFPLAIYAAQPMSYLQEAVQSMLVSRLAAPGLELVTAPQYAALLSATEKAGITDPQRAEDLARALKVDYAVYGSATVMAGGYSLDLSVLDLTGPAPEVQRISQAGEENQFIPQLANVAYQIRAVLEGQTLAPPVLAGQTPTGDAAGASLTKGLFAPQAAATSQPLEKGLFRPQTYTAQGIRPSGTLALDFYPMAAALTDIENDAVPELLILDRKCLYLYARQADTYRPVGEYASRMGEDFLKVSAGDADGDGRLEIYLVSRYGERACTQVLTWDKAFQRLDDQAGHLRFVATPKGKGYLFYQASAMDAFFKGPIYLMQAQAGGQAVKDKPLPLPESADIYTLTPHPPTSATRIAWLALNRKDDRLFAWDLQGTTLWRSRERLAGTNNGIFYGTSGPGFGNQGDRAPWVAFNPALAVADIDDDGTYEILNVHNISLAGPYMEVYNYTKAVLVAYRIDGEDLRLAFSTSELPYCVVDLAATGGAIYMIAQEPKLSQIGSGYGFLLWFK